MPKERWFSPGTPLGWRKEWPSEKRRRVALRHRKGDVLATARALQALSNVTKDKRTKILARSDAKYFYDKYRRKRR